MRLNNIWSPHESVPYSIWQDLKFSVSTMNNNVNVYMMCVFVCIVHAWLRLCVYVCIVCVWCVHLSTYAHTVYIVLHSTSVPFLGQYEGVCVGAPVLCRWA